MNIRTKLPAFLRRRLVLPLLGVALLALGGSAVTAVALSQQDSSDDGECSVAAGQTTGTQQAEDGKNDGEQADDAACSDSDSN